MTCACGHPRHHHAGGANCGTTRVWGPASPPDASAHIDYAGRNHGRCDCTEYRVAQ